ncbi:MAG: hypothetical protein IJ880_02275 [Bacilli bacterium]|nr:hypothetical protein [Bacilli bacterium]
MATIKQDGVTSVVNGLNTANQNFTSVVGGGVDKFVQDIQTKWASKNAKKFGNDFHTDLNNLVQAYIKNAQAIVDALSTNVQNHNSRNNGSVSFGQVEAANPNISSLTTGILESLSDGSEGIVPNVNVADTVSNYNQLIENVKSSAEQLISTMAGSEAFDPDEVSAMQEAQSKANNAFDEKAQELGQSLDSFLKNEDTIDAQLLKQNIANLTGK